LAQERCLVEPASHQGLEGDLERLYPVTFDLTGSDRQNQRH
jgi:hypothetical protein